MERLRLGDLEINIFKFAVKDRAFLAKMLGCLEPKYFESKFFNRLFLEFKDYFKKYDDIPSKEFAKNWLVRSLEEEKLEVIEAVLNDVYNENFIVKEAEKKCILDEVIIFAKRAKIKSALITAANLSIENKFDQVVEVMTDALKFNIDVNLGYDLYDVDARYTALGQLSENKLNTGYSQINDILGGGWTKKELFCVMGPPGMGKSIFLVNFGLAALINNYSVIHYSFEMSEERLGLRYDAAHSQIIQKNLIENKARVKEMYSVTKIASNGRLRIKEFPTATATIYDLEAHLEQLKMYESFVPDIVIVDYGDIMKSTRATKNAYEEQGWIFRELRGLAIKKNVVVITATQTRRDALDSKGGTKEVVGMDYVADSMEKNRILDVLFSITQNKNMLSQGQIGLFVAKNRNGESNKGLTFHINYGTMKITECIDTKTAKKIENSYADKQIIKEEEDNDLTEEDNNGKS